MSFIVMEFDQWPSSPVFILTFFQKLIITELTTELGGYQHVVVLKDTKVLGFI